MGKKGKWLSNVKKAFSPDSKKFKHKVPESQNGVISDPVLIEPTRAPPPFEVIVEQNTNECSPTTDVVAATAADISVVPSQPVPEVVHCSPVARFAGKSKEEAAAIRIQTAFRGYLARRALRALRGLVRLKSLMEGSAVNRQAANTLKCMQTLSRVQTQIQMRRIRVSEENQARQRQLLQKHAKELANLRNGDEWNDSTQSKEQVEANLLSKYEAAMRRERALAYAFSHQQNWKNSAKLANPMFMDPSNPTWGWSWLERWMAGRPWESSEKELNNDNSSAKGSTPSRNNTGGEITKSFIRHQLNLAHPSSPLTARTTKKNSLISPKTPSRPIPSSRKSKPTSPRAIDDDAKSIVSVQSENRRHSTAGSCVRDDESLASSPALPSYMVPTESARAKLKPHSPLGIIATEENSVADKAASAKKRLSYPGSPAPPKPRRFSAPPKVENGGGVNTEIAVRNGRGS